MNIGKFFKLLACLATVSAAFLLIADADGVSSALVTAAESCLTTIIPSLFGFMVLSSILISSGLYRILFKPLHLIFGWLLGMELYPFSVLLMSLLGGYPVGARLVAEMAEDKRNVPLCENMLCYCYCPSPSFAVTVMGLCIFGSINAGLVIYISNVLVCFLTAPFINRIYKNKCYNTAKKDKNDKQFIVNSVTSSGAALFKICAFILALAIIIELLRYLGLFALLGELFGTFTAPSAAAALEISTVTALSSVAYEPLTLPVAAALSSFGGICILFQTAALTDGKIKLKKFLLARIPLAFLSGAAAYFISMLLPSVASVSVKTVEYVQISSVKPLASAFLIVMCAILLKNCNIFSKKGSIF